MYLVQYKALNDISVEDVTTGTQVYIKQHMYYSLSTAEKSANKTGNVRIT
jgi:hypothetical protein